MGLNQDQGLWWMLCSMTGYGEGEYSDAQGYWKVEVRSTITVFDIQIRMARELSVFEDPFAPKSPMLSVPRQDRGCCFQGGIRRPKTKGYLE